MRIICDACESAPAVVFCAADEAALCLHCDNEVHKCNKLASRHVRASLDNPSEVARCDICENAPAFFFCEIDGSSLCLQCDMIVHVGGKRTHGRNLLLRQRVLFPGDQSAIEDPAKQPKDEFMADAKQAPRPMTNDHIQNEKAFVPISDANGDGLNEHTKLIDLNSRPQRSQGQSSHSQV